MAKVHAPEFFRLSRKQAAAQGLYHPRFEHDACGMGFVANVAGRKSNDIVRQALTLLKNLNHRGASGSEANTGDGAGMMLQVPHKFMQKVAAENAVRLPAAGAYGVGMIFLPREPAARARCEQILEKIVAQEGQILLGWRTVPTSHAGLGQTSRASEPLIRQLFVGRSPELAPAGALAFERKLYVIRRRVEKEIGNQDSGGGSFYVASLSARTIVYKGMLLSSQLESYYPDLRHPALETALALVHSRFSTNTFPSWERAHPYRYLIHNGEINTVRGNVNWMHARQALLASPLFGPDLAKVLPVIDPDGSDTAMFDNCLEFLVLAGRSLPHVVMMMIPEPWHKHESMDEAKRAFYEYHSTLMEPWDGPAAIAFTDGVCVGAVLDRNGLRPSRYTVTKDGVVVMASEVGVLDIPAENVLMKGRLEPGRMLLVDTERGRIVGDDELKQQMAREHPYRSWLDENIVPLATLPRPATLEPSQTRRPRSLPGVTQRQQAFGYTFEDLRLIIAPMAAAGVEAIGSMGDDTPLAVLSHQPQPLFNYFKQLFAQVTNPPLDALREELVTSTETLLGSEGNLLEPQPASARRIKLPHPILTDKALAQLRHVKEPGFKAQTLPILFPVAKGGRGLQEALDRLFGAADQAIAAGANLLILSDRDVNREYAAIPSLLATAGLHHHLIRRGARTRVSLLVESGEPRETHHFAVLIGYGADAVCPYLAFATIHDLIHKQLLTDVTYRQAVRKYVKATVKGVVKVMSKMGISTVQSYRGAQIFEALGLHHDLVDCYFTGTPSRIGGADIDAVAAEVSIRHRQAFPERPSNGHTLPVGGRYQWREEGEFHLFNPATVHHLQHAVRTGDYEAYQKYARDVNDRSQHLATLRGLLALKPAVKPIPLDEVESVESICRRFKTGAMSYGSISREAHESLAIAMNRIGAKSNTGEGGEDPARYHPDNNGDSRNSAIKQVASGRFGVTSEYLVNAQELQIKMAQGAKPGEGGQLPGRKVYPWIAEVRHSTPGVGLISPPPHHDIYSIEDLAQLIYDLKSANPQARINVKLVSEVGVGTIAAGVAKGHADVILISGHDGGTGASPQTSIKHAGLPWELGLAETHQTLLLNDLRSRVVLETDGQLKTGRDVVIAALLGAEEFGFASAPLVALGCIMMRVCHLDTCPVGIATQNPELRQNFAGDPQHVVNFMRFIAQDMRQLMAQLGFRTVDEMIGRTDKLEPHHALAHRKASGLDLSPLLYQPPVRSNDFSRPIRSNDFSRPARSNDFSHPPHSADFSRPARSNDFSRSVHSNGFNQKIPQDHGLQHSLDHQQLLDLCRPALANRTPVRATLPIRNIHRAVATTLGSELTRRYGRAGLPDGTIHLHFQGSAGQSFGAFIPQGITLELEGDANDYIGKGLSGGKIILYPPAGSTFAPEENVIAGNVAFYGATGGQAYINGVAGERFAVRNSGLTAVVEGVGDHGCEYMTGGRVVVLGRTGRNFAAGMSGGIAYVLDESGDFDRRCNQEMVDLEQLADDGEIGFVKSLIRCHLEYTGSRRALSVLTRWDKMRPKFVKVIPRDYRQMLQALAEVEAAGLSGEAAVLAAFKANQRNPAPVG